MLTKEQHLIRQSGIGGSDCAAICGISKWKTPLDIYLDKIGINDPNDQELSDAMHFGNLLEDIIANEYARRTEQKVFIETETLRHPKYPWMLANIDRWVGEKEFILECKTASIAYKEEWGAPGTDQIPEQYLMQIAWYAAICDKPKVDLAVLVGGNDFRIYTYERDKILEEGLIQITHDFWHNHVLKEIPPPAIELSDMTTLYPKENGVEIEAIAEIEEKIEQLKELKAHAKEVEEQIKLMQLEIQQFMGDAATLCAQNGHVIATWRNTKPRLSFDTKRFEQDYKELYDQYLKPNNGFRIFKVK